MLKNHLKIGWRNITRHKFNSFINNFGLTTGLTCCLLIMAYIINEVSYAFRISLVESWWVLPMAGMLALSIAFIPISFQSIKAALCNPVKSLRS